MENFAHVSLISPQADENVGMQRWSAEGNASQFLQNLHSAERPLLPPPTPVRGCLLESVGNWEESSEAEEESSSPPGGGGGGVLSEAPTSLCHF